MIDKMLEFNEAIRSGKPPDDKDAMGAGFKALYELAEEWMRGNSKLASAVDVFLRKLEDSEDELVKEMSITTKMTLFAVLTPLKKMCADARKKQEAARLVPFREVTPETLP